MWKAKPMAIYFFQDRMKKTMQTLCKHFIVVFVLEPFKNGGAKTRNSQDLKVHLPSAVQKGVDIARSQPVHPRSFQPVTVIAAAKLGEHSYTRYDRQPSSIGGGVQAVWRDNCINHGQTQKDLQWRVSIHALLLPTSATRTAELPTMQPLTSADVGTCVEARDLGANRTRFPPVRNHGCLDVPWISFLLDFQHLAKARQKRHSDPTATVQICTRSHLSPKLLTGCIELPAT